jgi:predicted permease
VRQLLAESVLLAVAGGAAGIGLSVLLLRALTAADLPLPFPITLDLAPDVRVLSFAVLVTVVAAVLFGLAPALQSTRADVSPVLREGATGAARGRFRLRELLVAAQVASSLVLLIAAGLFLRSFQARQDIDPGFGAAPAALVSAGLPRDRYAGEEGRLFIRTALERVRALPGVAAAGVTNNLHLDVTNTNTVDVNVDGHQPPAGRNAFQIDASVVDAGFFTAAAIPILRGRNFDEAADRPEGDPVVIVNQALVDRFWPGEDGIGRALRAGDEQWRIVGVARTAKIRLLGEASRPFIYMNVYQSGTSFPTFIVRTATDPNPTVGAVAGVLRTLDPQITINEMRTMDRHLAELLLPARLGAIVLVAISALALGLAVIGLYGMVSYAVARRTREVGIRMSIGADRGSVVRLMMASGVKLVAAGAGAGVLLAVALSSAVRGLLFGVTPLDPLTFVIVPAILCVVALLAAWLPARRASRIDPVRALRSQ